MKVQCPGCKSNYNIDISKIPAIPEGGITTTCPKCKAKIPIKLNAETAESKPEKGDKHSLLIPCPQCGHVNISSTVCAGCGRIFTKEEIDSLKIEIGGD